MIKIVSRDITSQTTSAIVNATHTSLLAGSGLSGAIHRVAGAELERRCREIGSCPTGEARITDAYNLLCKHVIHAVGGELATRVYPSYPFISANITYPLEIQTTEAVLKKTFLGESEIFLLD